jgi:uncharacterized protein YdiU (UPF0061 family)
MGKKKNNIKKSRKSKQELLYNNFSKINGNHPFKNSVHDGYVDYRVRFRHGGEVFYFNFDLAIEMGLIKKDHAPLLNNKLTKTLLDTFSIEIINEHDQINNTRIPAEDIKKNTYMATRYLQLQHPNKRGTTSGDGRSIWNGCFRGKGITWDISSCGTGATSLSPATAIEGKFFKTGDKYVSYGCGRSQLSEGLAAAINSEIFHYNGIATERTLAVIKYKDGSSINVRAARNLLRPAHMFRYLKQNNYHSLNAVVDYYINREITNKSWPDNLNKKQNYQYLLDYVTRCFANLAATLESEYIFCWMDWDGDNIMMDGGVIDFGSIRQFGLFHSEYRYDDVERMSTTISGQKHQARYIVQTFAQLVDFLLDKKKKNIKLFKNHKCLKDFDKIFTETKEKLLLRRIGFNNNQIDRFYSITPFRNSLKEFMKVFSYFERTQSSYGVYKVSDGITSDAVFCMRDVLRELPKLYLHNNTFVDYTDFIDISRSEYAEDSDVRLYPGRKKKIKLFQEHYKQLLSLAASHSRISENNILRKISENSDIINRYDRITGDAIIYVNKKMIKINKDLGTDEMYKIFRNFISEEILVPEYLANTDIRTKPLKKSKSKKVLQHMLKIVKDSRSGL